MEDSSGEHKKNMQTTMQLENRVYLIESTIKWSDFFVAVAVVESKPLRKTNARANVPKESTAAGDKCLLLCVICAFECESMTSV